MSIRDDFEAWYGATLTTTEKEVLLRKTAAGDYHVPSAQSTWAMWQPAYQSATERALRELHVLASKYRGAHVNSNELLGEAMRRIKGDSNG